MRIIPVMDVLDGAVVHAVRGLRSEYLPVKSVLCASAQPLDVAAAFKAVGFSELYVADLDAIMGRHVNFSMLERIADTTGLDLMVDAGVADLERAEELLRNHVSKVIIGTETLPRISFLEEALKSLGKERVMVSLDLKGKKVISEFERGKSKSRVGLLRELQRMGVEQIIVLDLAKVGSEAGVNMSILKEALRNVSGKVFVGGGVRDLVDLVELENVGVFGVLVATALHSGKISLKELRNAGFL